MRRYALALRGDKAWTHTECFLARCSGGRDNAGMRPAILFLALFVVVDLCLAGQPRPRENKFMKIELAGLEGSPLRSGPGLAYLFAFVLKQPVQVTRVRVEDLTDKQPVLLVDDRAPKVTGDRWSGRTRAQPMTHGNFPWVFDDFHTKKLFRFTVSTRDQGEISLEQPARFDVAIKEVLRKINPKKSK